ncbi:hypothetical protein GPECTOR_37g162 [Gonium pectorale]|uniref:Uncharacterized protein n=1 Tax=Gonium pectorale TaxID=33097 RepID=A0A150GBE0_GONPE|nr:hypothetical protein GPECTOR_37g162 [Gonium pectorale]|eukprot:KXZ47156.1 hypothetical protein GPECTOR_37g162 [Gonium pectorale]
MATSRVNPLSAGGGEAPSFVAVDRFRYSVVGELAAGARAFLVTCNFRSHCQRLIPLDATCELTAAGLARAVAAAAAAHRARQPGGAVSEPFTYAIAYHSRDNEVPPAAAAATAPAVAAAAGAPPAGGSENGGPSAGGDSPKANPASGPAGAAEGEGASRVAQCRGQGEGRGGGGGGEGGDGGALSDRGRIISVVAAGMAAAFGQLAKVDLKRPQVAVVVEAFPVAGRQFAGLALLGPGLFLARGKLLVKPLAQNPPTHQKQPQGQTQPQEQGQKQGRRHKQKQQKLAQPAAS